jgi:prepilin-type processing-associated H-X9-DG protein
VMFGTFLDKTIHALFADGHVRVRNGVNCLHLASKLLKGRLSRERRNQDDDSMF